LMIFIPTHRFFFIPLLNETQSQIDRQLTYKNPNP
jgi:hypothetical protein